MKELVILSGKGGTGKTSITASFARLADRPVIADCDVDAADLHLVIPPTIRERHVFMSGHQAVVMEEVCCNCGVCLPECRFGAIMEPVPEAGHDTYWIDPTSCEGCGVCARLCPTGAILLQPEPAGELELYQQGKVFSTARLRMGQGTSGRLVTEVKKQLKRNMGKEKLVVLDGSPGIGCPVIASLAGVDIVLMVAEPSVSGLSDMKRLVRSAGQFQIPMLACINKYDLNPKRTKEIEAFCQKEGIPLLGGIPFDAKVIELVNRGMCIADAPCNAGAAVEGIYQKICKYLVQRTRNN